MALCISKPSPYAHCLFELSLWHARNYQWQTCLDYPNDHIHTHLPKRTLHWEKVYKVLITCLVIFDMKIFIVTAHKSEKWFTYASDSQIFQTLNPFLSVQPSMKVKHFGACLVLLLVLQCYCADCACRRNVRLGVSTSTPDSTASWPKPSAESPEPCPVQHGAAWLSGSKLGCLFLHRKRQGRGGKKGREGRTNGQSLRALRLLQQEVKALPRI